MRFPLDSSEQGEITRADLVIFSVVDGSDDTANGRDLEPYINI